MATKAKLPIDDVRLARYMPLSTYVPDIGDFVIWSGWFRTWYGVVNYYTPPTERDPVGELSVIFEGLPSLLFTLTDEEQRRNTHRLSLDKIRNAMRGTFAILKHNVKTNVTVWYV